MVQSLGYIRRVLPQDISQFNSFMQGRGLAGYNLDVAGPEYLVVEHMFPSRVENVRLGLIFAMIRSWATRWTERARRDNRPPLALC